jgi:NADH dehydrogenase
MSRQSRGRKKRILSGEKIGAEEMDLIVGGTGILGHRILKGLVAKGRPLRALVRTVSDPQKVAAIKDAGVETVLGDLKDPESLVQACAGIDTVISSATCTLARAEGDGVETVDLHGQMRLVETAKAAGVKHFIFVSFAPDPSTFILQDAKRAVEDCLVDSGISYTILRPPHFNESWLGPRLGLEPKQAKVRVFGNGEGKISWIAMEDVAKATVAAVDNPKALNQIIPLGGPEALSQSEVIDRYEKAAGRPFTREVVSLEEIEAGMASEDTVARSVASLMMTCARHGCPIDNSLAKETLGFDPSPVDTYIANSLKD